MATTNSEADTSELEILSIDLIPSEEELEMDADTFSLDDSQPTGQSAESLHSDLRSKDERISSLQFDIEQLRARWNGLEKEIEAREELTSILQADLRSVHKQLQERDRHIRKLEKQLEHADAAETVAIENPDRLDSSLDAVDARIDRLKRQAGEDADRIRELERELENARSEQASGGTRWLLYGDLPRKYSERGKELKTLQRSEEALQRELRETDSDRGRVKAMLKVAQKENADLKSRLREYRTEIDDYSANERPSNLEQIAAQRGQIVELNGQLTQLEQRLQTSEQYGDELRRKLAEARSGDEDITTRAAELEESLAEARDGQANLEASLAEAMRTIESREAEAAELRNEHEETLRKMRAELDEAGETIDSLNRAHEEVAAELIERATAFERSLSEKQKQFDEEIRSLTARFEEAQREVADARVKLENKDKSIAALLSELANSSQSIDSIHEIEEAIHDLNGRISDRIDDRVVASDDLPTRALVGSFEGSDVQFPLEKARLTIGRTTQNDIQLPAQYISRHHAILVIEDGRTRIIDRGSKNGIYVNGEQVAECDLANGDRVAIGNADFVYEEQAPNAPPE